MIFDDFDELSDESPPFAIVGLIIIGALLMGWLIGSWVSTLL